MMNLLAIDTATDLFSVAITSGDSVSLRDTVPQWGTWLLEADVGLRHSELSMDSIDMLMRQAALKAEDLNGIVCMGGPGSFTGLRIGFSLAKGLACALGIPFAAIPTLDCMAWPFSSLPGIVVPVIDAKKGAYFCALYQNGKRLCPDMDAAPAEIAAAITSAKLSISPLPTLLTGPGASLLYEKLCAMDPESGVTLGKNLRWGNAAALLHIARETGIITPGNNGYAATNTGPEYIRKSVTNNSAPSRGVDE
jgi:tRNA threonylcarbamoyladenosine biosynthesis protein TsaB